MRFKNEVLRQQFLRIIPELAVQIDNFPFFKIKLKTVRFYSCIHKILEDNKPHYALAEQYK